LLVAVLPICAMLGRASKRRQMIFRVIGSGRGVARGGVDNEANQALDRLLSLERQGVKRIEIRDDAGRSISREALVRLARQERGALDP